MTVHSREIRWRQLAPGLLALAVLVLTAVTVLTRLKVGNIPGSKFTIYALTDQARGVLRGSDVWIAGQRVGTIGEVTFLPAASGASERVVLELRIVEAHQGLIRRDSKAQVKLGTRVIGNPVLHVSLGSATETPIEPGDTIATVSQFDADEAIARAEQAMTMLPLVMRDLRAAAERAAALEPLLAAFLAPADSANPGESRSIFSLINSVAAIAGVFEGGTADRLLHDSTLTRRLTSVRQSGAALLSIYDVNASPAGRYLGDPAFFARLDSTIKHFAAVSALVNARTNDQIAGARGQQMAREIDRLSASLRALRADLRRNPFRYIVF